MKWAARSLAVLLTLHFAAAAAAGADIRGRRILLDPQDETVVRVGELVYRGGLDLRWDEPRFGGLSALMIAPDGSWFLSASDRGSWVRARLGYAEEGWLDRVFGATIDSIPKQYGPAGHLSADTESLAHAGSDVLVAFEGRHALALFATDGAGRPFGPGRPIEVPDGLGAAPDNRGVEALAQLADGSYLALTEGLAAGKDALRGWVGGPGRGWQPLAYAVSDGFVPTGATRAPGGAILVLERRFSLLGGLAARILALDPAAIRPGARLSGRVLAEIGPELNIDNFEGIAARRGPDGETLIYIVSDDNFGALQRTLLLMFAWPGH